MAAVRRRITGVVFDMDGTLTKAILDFGEMRKAIGIAPGSDILHEIYSWSCKERQAQALATIETIETDARERMQLQPGALELLSWVDGRGLRRGLITRNNQEGVRHLHDQHVCPALAPFEPALSREFKPYKPDPAALLHIAETWKHCPTELAMVGDSAKDDIVSGNRGGAVTILLDIEGKYGEGSLEGDEVPDYTVRTLGEVSAILERDFELPGGDS